MPLDEMIPVNRPAGSFDDLVPDYKDVQKQGLDGSLFVAGQTTPDRAAEAVNIATKYQVDPQFAHDNLDQLKQSEARSTINTDQLMERSPGVAEFFQKPENASIGQDDLDSLHRIDQSTRQYSKKTNYVEDLGVAASFGFNDFQEFLIKTGVAGGFIDSEMGAHQISSIRRDSEKMKSLEPDYVGEFNKILQSNYKDLSKSIDEFSSVADTYRRDSLLEALKQFGSASTDSIGSLLDLTKKIALNPRGFGYETTRSLVSTTPAIATGFLGAAGAPALATTAATFLAGAPVFVGQWFGKKLEEKGIDQNNPESLQKAFSDPALMAELRQRAFSYGVPMATIQALLPLTGGAFLKTTPSIVQPGISNSLNTVGRAAAGVGLQTGILTGGQVASEAIAGEKPDLAGAAQNFLMNLGQGAAFELAGSARKIVKGRETFTPGPEDILPPDAPVAPEGDTITVEPDPKQLAARRENYPADPIEALDAVTHDVGEAFQTVQDLQSLDAMGQAVKESKTSKRVPNKIEELIQASGGEGDVYFSAKDWDQYWSQKGLSPAKAAEQILEDQGRAYLEAKETGADFKIPLAKYVSKVAPTEDYDSLLNIVKTQPDGMKFEDAKAHMDALPENIQKLSEEAKTIQTEKDFKKFLSNDEGIQAYQNLEGTEGGKIINQDLARLLYQPYAKDREGRILNIEQTQKPTSDFIQKLYEKKLQEPATGDVVFMAGGSGAGKSTVADNVLDPIVRDADIVFDGVLANADRASKNIDAALQSGRQVSLIYVYRPLDLSIDGIVKRFQDIGRSVPAKRVVEGHVQSLETFTQLAEKYKNNPDVAIQVVDNSSDSPRLLSVDELKKLSYSQGDETVDQTIERLLPGVEGRLQSTNAEIARTKESRTTGRRDSQSSSGSQGQGLSFSESLTTPLFSDPAMAGMTPAQAERYLKLQNELKSFSEETLRAQRIQELKRKQSKDYAMAKDMVQNRISDLLNRDPVYRALSILKDGTLPDGSELPEGIFPIKLSKEEIVQNYDKDYVSGLPQGIFNKENGLPADMAAEILGFKNGEDLLHSIANAPTKKSVIQELASTEMQRLYPSVLEEPKISDAEIRSLHNDKKAEILRMELEHLASDQLPQLKGVIRDISRRVPTDLEVRQKAADMIGEKNIQTIRPYEYELAERKAAREAGEFLAQGNIEEAYLAKRRELLNHELYQEAVAAEQIIDRSLQQFRKASKPDEQVSKTRDADIVNAARSLLAQHGIGKTIKSPAEYLKNVFNYAPEKYELIKDLLPENAAPYRDLSFTQFMQLKNSFDALWSLAKSEMEILIEGKKISKLSAIESIKEAAAGFEKKKKSEAYKRTLNSSDQNHIDLRALAAAGRITESLIDQWDKGNVGGKFRELLFTPVNEGIERYRDAKVSVFKKLDEAIDSIRSSLKMAKIQAPELGYEFGDKSFLLGALLHTGNESNLSKLLRGRGWGEYNEDGSLNRSRWDQFISRMQKEGVLTKADYDFAQAVWDIFDLVKADAQKAHHEMYGYYFNEITAQPLNTPYGEYRGGYVPAKVDPYENLQAEIRAEKNAFENIENAWAFPTTGRGFTKSRVDDYAAPLQLALNYVKSALDWELRFVHIEPRVKETAKLLWDKEVRSDLNTIHPYAVKEVLIPWLQRATKQTVTEPGAFKSLDKLFRNFRTASTLQFLFLDVSNAAQQLTGFFPATVKVKPSYLIESTTQFLSSPKKTTATVMEKSAFMRHHASDQLTHIEESIYSATVNPSLAEKTRDVAKKMAPALSKATQHIVDISVWLAAYNQEIASTPKNIDSSTMETRAVRAGDRAVRLTQGSAFPEHVSRWMVGSPGQRLLTMFGGYFNMIGNLQLSEQTQAHQNRSSSRKAYVGTMGLIAPFAAAAILSKLFSGNKDRDNDGSYADDLFKAGLTGVAGGTASLIPVAGSLLNSTAYALTKANPAGAQINFSPALSALEKGVKGAGEFISAAKKNKPLKGQEIQDVFTLLGLATNLPLAPISRPFSYIQDVNQRNIKPPTGPIDLARGLVTGRGNPRKK